MGFLDRMSRVFRANVNDMLDRAEDPEKMLDQIIRDMEQAIKDAKEQVAEAIVQEKQMKKDLRESQDMAEKWFDKARLAVQKGRDDLAKEALRRKKDYDAQIEIYQKQWEAQDQAVTNLKAQLEGLENKLEKAKRDREVLIARRQRAKTQQQISRTGAKTLDMPDYADELERMEERIEAEEARAEAMVEMEDEDVKLEEELAALEEDDDMDGELAALKEDLGMA